MTKETQLLVLDDEQNDLTSIEHEFRDVSFKVATTTNPDEAMKIIAEEKIKVVMSDQRMPKTTGVEFLAQVAKKYPDVVRVLFAGYVDNQEVQDAINIGHIFRFITKPWRSATLRLVIDQSMKYHDLLVENRKLFELTNKSNEELTELNKKLTKMLYVRKEFAAIASHEIRTALAAVKSPIDLVLAETTGELNDDQKGFLAKIQENVGGLHHLIADILELIKLESKEFEFDRSVYDFKVLVGDILHEYQNAAQEKGLTLNNQVPEDGQQVCVDESQIQIVLRHIFDNALKFTDRGEINITSRIVPDKNVLEVCIEDTGKGIHDGDIEKIFEKFGQFGKTQKHVGGTGLGLAICKEIILCHEGEIWVESQYGKGSRFYFTVPLYRNEAPA